MTINLNRLINKMVIDQMIIEERIMEKKDMIEINSKIISKISGSEEIITTDTRRKTDSKIETVQGLVVNQKLKKNLLNR